ncbi:BTAD domain-containing putative transcriptional regulator [Cohnella nanjingensis]|uniref:Response regulator n=1 Tax=Cohnella nanjingensis TaxID=1387779 RepID=A0A7X0RPR6_9BACL|nr:BTAD domain-containing putative transcriptional regulator [Cohnella nanjingensis]MBB6671271.1 response regulator [Cohnella nanjingensis]
MIRAMIVDDEELSIMRLGRILAESREVEVCGTFQDPAEAYRYAGKHPVDVAFLDISMPKIDGMRLSDLLSDLNAGIATVFVTGYDEYAVEAFERSAVDYLMKPVTAERLGKTLSRLRGRSRGPAVEKALEIRLFGGLQIGLWLPDNSRETVKLRSPKTEELFAYLVCRSAASREEIVDALWPDLHPDKALNNLNTNLYYIRKALGGANASACIQSDRNEVRIDKNLVFCDLYAFQQMSEQIRLNPRHDPELFRQAEALYAGELLNGRPYEWAAEFARRLERDRLELLERAARYEKRHGELPQALRYYEEMLKADPIREDIHQEVVRLYLAMGRNHEALRQYRELETIMRRELGTGPDPALLDLLRRAIEPS